MAQDVQQDVGRGRRLATAASFPAVQSFLDAAEATAYQVVAIVLLGIIYPRLLISLRVSGPRISI